MLSTDLPITDWWDPEWDLYDVPGCPQGDTDADEAARKADFAAWWAAYDHHATLAHIMTGRRWHGPDNLYAHQLEPPRRPPSWYPGQPDPPKPRKRPCTCMYIRHYLFTGAAIPGVEIVVNPVIATTFHIVFDCPHHGDDLIDIETELDDLYRRDGGVWGFTAEDC